MEEITLKLKTDEVDGILKVLGNLPTASNAWPLMMKIGEQIKEQQPKVEEVSQKE